MSDAIDTDEAREAWHQAQAHALAAAALLDDPSVPPWTSAVHLRSGYLALARAAGLSTTIGELDPTKVQWLPAPNELAAPLRTLAEADDAALDPTMLRRLAVALAAAITTAGDATFAPDRRAQLRRRRIRRSLLGVVIAVPLVAAILVTMPDYREGPWRAHYFDNPELAGTPVGVTRESDVRFRWDRGAPNKQLGRDSYSVRFDTCLVLDEPLLMTFQLISDDGSRLYVDGERVVDNWGVHAEQSAGADVQIAAGVHHVRIDYFEDRALAQIELLASLHGEVPAMLPARLLRHPERPLDDDPCGEP